MREDQDDILGVEFRNRSLADGQDILVADCWSRARFEKQNAESETLRLQTLVRVESLDPVHGRDASVLQAGCINDVEDIKLLALGHLGDTLD